MKKNSLRIKKITKINDMETLLNNKRALRELKIKIKEGELIIIKNVISKKILKKIKKYLVKIGSNSLPKYQPIALNAPNHHRIIKSDPRSFVKGCFHQFSFFQWNQDMFNFFELTKKIFWLKNLLANKKKDAYLGINNDSNIVSRVAFQFYPRGEGYLNLHQDPVGIHQVTAPILIMSNKSKNGDFTTGGSYVLDFKNKKIFIEDHASIGDLVIYNVAIPHGVEIIDEKKKFSEWINFKGRWMMLLATNKVNENNQIKDSKDLG